MTGFKVSNDKRLVLISGRAHPVLAQAVAEELSIDLLPIIAYDFANSEIYVRFEESVRGADVFILQSHPDPINKWVMEQLIMVDAAKRASAKRITASQSQGFFDGPVDHLWAMPTLVEYVRGRVDATNAVVVSPDAGRIKVAEQWGNRLGGVPLAFVHKTRDLTRPNQATANRVVGDVAGRTAIIVDDLIDTAGTICGAVRVVLEAGAKDVIVAATHGVLSDPATKRLQESGLRELVITDTLPIGPEKRFPGMTVLSIAPVLARAIDEVFEDGSVTSLFAGAY